MLAIRRFSVLAVSLFVLSSSIAVGRLGAADFAVSRYDDPTPSSCSPTQCSLREAVITANQTPGPDRILLSAGTYELTIAGNQEDGGFVGDLDLLDDVEIIGVAANLTIIDANFLIDRALDVPLVADLVIRLVDLAVTGGSGTFLPSAVRAFRAEVTIERSEIYGNLGGGAAVSAGAFAHLTVRDSTLQGNGGGLACSQSDCVLENVTLSDNGSVDIRASIGALVACRHCTVYDELGTPVVELDHSAIDLANSVIQGQCQLIGLGSFVFSAGGNLEAPGHTCSLAQANDVDDVFTAALLGLTFNGGATRSRRPQADGPSANGGLAANCLPELDQTGFPRPSSGCDRGSVEAAQTRTLIPIFIDGFQQGDAEAWSAVAP